MKTNVILVMVAIALVAGLGVGFVGATATASPSTPKPTSITLITEGHSGGMLAIDNLRHDTVMPANFTIYVGQKVTLVLINFDEGPHTITSPNLATSTGTGIDFQYPGYKAAGVPSVTTFTFTATKAGTYVWYCRLPCDAGQGGWAMTPGANGAPAQVGFMAGYITVLGS